MKESLWVYNIGATVEIPSLQRLSTGRELATCPVATPSTSASIELIRRGYEISDGSRRRAAKTLPWSVGHPPNLGKPKVSDRAAVGDPRPCSAAIVKGGAGESRKVSQRQGRTEHLGRSARIKC